MRQLCLTSNVHASDVAVTVIHTAKECLNPRCSIDMRGRRQLSPTTLWRFYARLKYFPAIFKAPTTLLLATLNKLKQSPFMMGEKRGKRGREPASGANEIEAPVKRRRQLNEEHLKLSKLYEDLAAESDDARFEAAKELIGKFSPQNNPAAKDVETALGRLIKGLCSQRKAARVGFSLTLTELLREIFGQSKVKIEGLGLDVISLINLVEEKTKVEGNVPGRVSAIEMPEMACKVDARQERRDHLIGRLFGYKAVLQSSIVITPEPSMECWNKLLDHIYGMARDVPWLREECGMVLIEAAKSLRGESRYQECAREMIDRLNAFKLVSTPEGVAIWLTVRADYEKVLPEGVWQSKDPLSKKERTRLAKILKENYQGAQIDGDKDMLKTAAASPNPTFAWNLVLAEILRRDDAAKSDAKDSSKADFPQFWVDIVDSRLHTCL